MKYKYIQVLSVSTNSGNLKKEYGQIEGRKPEIQIPLSLSNSGKCIAIQRPDFFFFFSMWMGGTRNSEQQW